MASRVKEGLSKFHGEIQFTATGIFGPTSENPWLVGGESSLRIAVENVGVTNAIVVYGRIRNQSAYVTLATITGATTGTTVDISLIDEVYLDCTTYEASGGTPKLISSSFSPPGSGGSFPTGLATEAKQDTQIALETTMDASLASIDSKISADISTETKQDAQIVQLGAIQNAVEIIDNAISGTEMQVDIVASLPAGANAIGSVTVNNAAGASAVNIQDGGNSITVDGTIAATQSGTWNVNNVSGTVSLPTGAATAANQSTEITSLQIMDDWDESDRAKVNPIVGQAGVQGGSGTVSANTQRVVLATDVGLPTGSNTIGTVTAQQSTAANLNAQVSGSGANLSAPGNPVSVAFQDLIGGVRVMPNTFNFGGANYQLVLAPDLALQFLSYNSDGSMNCRTGSPNGTLASAVYLATDANRNQRLVGSVDHDATDSGSPIKIGGRTTSLTGEQTAVSVAGDRADAYFDTKGYQHVKTNAHRLAITTLHSAVTFNNVTTASNSSSVDLTRYRYAKMFFVLTKAGSPTSISLIPQFSPDGGTTWCDYRDWEWSDLIYSSAQIPLNECLALNAAGGALGSNFRLRATASGTTAINTFTLTSYIEALT